MEEEAAAAVDKHPYHSMAVSLFTKALDESSRALVFNSHCFSECDCHANRHKGQM